MQYCLVLEYIILEILPLEGYCAPFQNALYPKFVSCALTSIGTATPLPGQSNAFLRQRDNTTSPCRRECLSFHSSPCCDSNSSGTIGVRMHNKCALNISAALALTSYTTVFSLAEYHCLFKKSSGGVCREDPRPSGRLGRFGRHREKPN